MWSRCGADGTEEDFLLATYNAHSSLPTTRQVVFKEQQAEYAQQGIPWQPIAYEDNSETLVLLEGSQATGEGAGRRVWVWEEMVWGGAG